MRFNELYLVMQSPCEAMIERLTLSPRVAADLYDEVMTRAFSRWTTLRLRKVPHRYVARTVLARSLDLALSGRLAQTAELNGQPTLGLSEADIDVLNDRRAVAAGLRRLRRPVREAVAYSYLAGFGAADTAHLAGITETEAQAFAKSGVAELRGWLTVEQINVLVA